MEDEKGRIELPAPTIDFQNQSLKKALVAYKQGLEIAYGLKLAIVYGDDKIVVIQKGPVRRTQLIIYNKRFGAKIPDHQFTRVWVPSIRNHITVPITTIAEGKVLFSIDALVEWIDALTASGSMHRYVDADTLLAELKETVPNHSDM